MKPVWIIDDDRSIRWVFEKALARENIPFRVFSSALEAQRALDVETPQVMVSDIACPGIGPGAAAEGEAALSRSAGHHHDGILRSR